MCFGAPQYGAIEMALGPQQSLAAHFILPKRAGDVDAGISYDEALSSCELWCRDYDRLLQKLAARHILVAEHTRTSPAEGEFEEREVPQEFFEDDVWHGGIEEKHQRGEL